MSATYAVPGLDWARPGGRAVRAVPAVLVLCLVLAGAGAPAKRLLTGPPSGLSKATIGLQAAISAAVGAGNPAFAVRDHNGTLAADGGGLSSVFARSGAVVQSGHGHVGLQFAGIGYGTLTRPAPAVPHASRNVVSYHRSGVSEWYRSGPLGLEQGFTVTRRPTGKTGAAWLTVAVNATGSLQPKRQGAEIVFGDALRYGGLSAVDATGRSLPVRLELSGRTLLLRVDDTNARYPLTIDPLVQQGPVLTPSDEVGDSSFGWSLALSADGNTALIGAPGSMNSGAQSDAWIFVRSGSTWTQQGPALTRDATTAFGYSVALSADGNTALIGDIDDFSPANGHDEGAVWAFTRTGSTWSQQGPALSAADEVGAGNFGGSVSLSSDGNIAVIGAPFDNGTGAAWIFVRSGSSWTEGTKLHPTDETGSGWFGWSAALSGDGETAAIGAPDDNSSAGAAWIFSSSGSTWTQQGQKLTPSDEVGAGKFGWSVALSGDGNTALAGGYADNSLTGAAWSFARSGTTWAQQGAKITDTDNVGDQGFGVSTVLSTDGDTALIGGLNSDPDSAIAFLFRRSGSTWTPEGETPHGVPGSGLATGFTISGDGSTVLVAGDHANSDAGEVLAFANTATTPDAPGTPYATTGVGQATIDFTPPAFDGGAPVTSYTVTAAPGGETATGNDSPITVTGLSAGTSYTFTVTATNSAGTSPPSVPSNPVTPVALTPVPGLPCCPAAPDLAVTIAAPAQVNVGSQATFTVTVSDLNSGIAFDSQALVTLPAGATLDSVSSDRGFNCTAGASPGTVDCPLSALGYLSPFFSPILVAHITVVVTLPTAGPATLSATASDAEGDQDTSNNTASATVQVRAPATTTPTPTPKPVAKKTAATVAIVRVQTVHLGKKPTLHVTLKLSKATRVALTLLDPKGKIVARWSVQLKAGTRTLALAVPAKARHKGRDTLRVQIGTSKPKTTRVLIRA